MKGEKDMACKLYCKHRTGNEPIGTFSNRQKAEEFWNAIWWNLATRYGSTIEPIYVETGKGKQK